MAKVPPAPPNGNFYVATSLAQAQSWASAVDSQQGYPRRGVESGPGPGFVTDPDGSRPFTTTTYASILAHPNGTQWAYPSDTVTDPIVGPLAVGITPAALDVTWVGGVVAPAGPGIAKASPLMISMRRNAVGIGAIAIATAGILGGLSLGAAPAAQITMPEAGALDEP